MRRHLLVCMAVMGLVACSSESEGDTGTGSGTGGAAGTGGAEPNHVAYQGCAPEDATVICAAGSDCIKTDVVPVASGYCSASCDVANDCPDDPEGRTKVCEQPDGATTKLCYVTCPSASSTCPEGTVCRPGQSAEGTALSLCVPRD